MRVLLTRPEADSARTAQALEERGVDCLSWPLTRIVSVVDRIDLPPDAEALLFTSANAVRVFAGLSAQRDLPVLAVGDRTAAEARDAGFSAVTSARGDARDLARLARATRWRRFVHPRGREVAADLAGQLGEAGLSVEAPVIYAAEPADGPSPEVERALRDGALDVITVWSPRAGAILRDRLAQLAPPLGEMALLGISENAVAPLRGAGFQTVAVAARPQGSSMLQWILAALQP